MSRAEHSSCSPGGRPIVGASKSGQKLGILARLSASCRARVLPRQTPHVQVAPRLDAYSPKEIALAAGVPVEKVLAILNGRRYVPYSEALQVARVVARLPEDADLRPIDAALFSIFSPPAVHLSDRRAFMAVSATLHAGVAVALVLLALIATSQEAAMTPAEHREAARLVFLSDPGPGGGGGGGGRLMKTAAPQALREGHAAVSSPLPVRRAAPPEPVPRPVEPPPLKSELLPVVVAPIITAPADRATRLGVLTSTRADASFGPGRQNGVGSGAGTGTGEGTGPGVGTGSGGGTGGGPYRAGSGIEAPRLLREVKADYTEAARQRGLTGDVLLEIIVRADGSVSDVKVLHGLGLGLDDRAVQAVQQWRFSPARRMGTPVDVVVEVAVEFKLR